MLPKEFPPKLKLSHIKFHIGKTEHSVKVNDITPETSLNTYLRETLNLKGTKRMCLEGGCGTCLVVVEDKQRGKIFSVNSCLVSIFSCHGWKIHTVEGIKEELGTPHPVQKALADFNGTQCGFCSSGMVMNMYALYQNGDLSMQTIEDSFGGNICRCTGYRSILTAFKSLAHDADYELLGLYPDIEDTPAACPKRTTECGITCKGRKNNKLQRILTFELDDARWVKVYQIEDIFQVLSTPVNANYMLVAGNTAQGVYRPTVIPDVYIDVTEVDELTKTTILNNSIILGGNTTLNNAIAVFRKAAASGNTSFSYLDQVAEHISLIANVPVRNIGTLAGNLMTKHSHPEFPSDIFLLTETLGATILIVDDDESEVEVSPEQFLGVNMVNKVIKSIKIFGLDSSHYFRSYKIMPRTQNVRAAVNAGFLLKLSEGQTVESASIVFGGINPQFVHSVNTERILIDRPLFDNDTLKAAIDALNQELDPDLRPPNESPAYRKGLAISLFYKFILSIAPPHQVTDKYRSGGALLERPISSGLQDFETKKSLYPLTQPIPKIEALAQTTGVATYVNDEPDLPGQLHATLVSVKAVANSTIVRVDASRALKIPGVVAFLTKDDIPGQNTFVPSAMNLPVQEELFCSGRVQYYNQPLGVLVAESRELVEDASELISVTVVPGARPMLSVREVLRANESSRVQVFRIQEPTRRGNDVVKVIQGEFEMGWQYHFHMELQCCNVIPVEDGLEMHPATQWMDLAQIAAASVLDIPANKIEVKVRRLGGAFGAKISRSAILSCATALAAYKLQKPVKMWLPMEKNMDMIGKRDPVYCQYEVGVNSDGAIQYMDLKSYTDYGVGGNDISTNFLLDLVTGNYNTDTWKVSIYSVKTDNHGSAWTRAPGSVTGLAIIESVMDHIASEINKDPSSVRLANMDVTNKGEIVNIFTEVMQWADVDNRRKEIDAFNENNRWKKRGMSVSPMSFDLQILFIYSVIVSLFQGDGTVTILHGGIEMGQGLNTKACQVCAYKLGIPLSSVTVKPSYNSCTPNCGPSGGSLTSEAVCYGVIKACDVLIERLRPYRNATRNWVQTLKAAHTDGIQLFSSGSYSKQARDISNYKIYGACATEVEVDILTGQHIIRRVDLIEDTGQSMSPVIDVGQVEGAFVMGLGYFLMENIVYSAEGELLTNRTWTYWPPTAKDIPVDFRVRFPGKPNPAGVLQSKATGEPPMCLACTIPLAIRDAVGSARSDSSGGQISRWFPFSGPTTIESTFLNSLSHYDQYTL